MVYTAKAHFSGTAASDVDLTAQQPWVYVIASLHARILYVGETYDSGGLVVRLSSHFGPYGRSSLRRAAFTNAGVTVLRSPFVVVAALLPRDDPNVSFDGTNKGVRVLVEARVQESIARFALNKPGWAVVSTVQGARDRNNQDIAQASESIAACFFEAFHFLEDIVPSSPFHLVVLSHQPEERTSVDAGELLNKIEVILYDKVVRALRTAHGSDWWRAAVPESIRVDCVTKKEREPSGADIPVHAYLTFIDLRAIIDRNWSIFAPLMETISGHQGKRPGTRWLVELNTLRNTWAHPIKQRFVPAVEVAATELQRYLKLLQEDKTL